MKAKYVTKKGRLLATAKAKFATNGNTMRLCINQTEVKSAGVIHHIIINSPCGPFDVPLRYHVRVGVYDNLYMEDIPLFVRALI